MDYDADAASTKGAELFDLMKPDWAPKIDRRRINMLSPTDCIVGQLYGEFKKALPSLPVLHSRERQIEHAVRLPDGRPDLNEAFVAAWNRRIDERLAA